MTFASSKRCSRDHDAAGRMPWAACGRGRPGPGGARPTVRTHPHAAAPGGQRNHEAAQAAAADTEGVRFTSSNLLTWSVCYRISTARVRTAAKRYGQHDVPSLDTAEFPIDMQTPPGFARQHTPHGYAGQTARESGQAMTGYVENKDEYLKRLRRIEGQVRGLQRMVADDTYCIDVLTQVSAATKALQSVALGLLDEHMSHCLVDAARVGGVEQDAKLKEASEAIARLVRS